MLTERSEYPKRPVQALCQRCHTKFDTHEHAYRGADDWVWLVPGMCNPCFEQKQSVEEKEQRILAELREKWKEKCPNGYDDTKTDQIGQWPQCLEWLRAMQTSGRGLYLWGPPRRRKTRAAWMLMKEISFRLRWRWDAHLWSRFMQDLAGAYNASAEVAGDMIDRACRVQMLFIDDVGQDVATARAGDTLKKILEERASNRRPTIITSNYGGEALQRHYGDFGEQIRGRIRDHFEQIQF